MANAELDMKRLGKLAHWPIEDVIGGMTLKSLMFSNDYRYIAIKGMLTSLVMLALGGHLAARWR